MSGPVLIQVDPIQYETLMSLSVRTANINVLPSWHVLLSQAGATHANNPTAAANALLDHNRLAEVFRLPVEEISKRCVSKTGEPGFVNHFGSHVRADEIEYKRRRFAPAALGNIPYMRALWSLKMVPCCTESWQYLIDICRCGNLQKWRNVVRVDRCDRCNRRLDLIEGVSVDPEFRDGLSFLLGLLDPDQKKNAAARSQLPVVLSEWDGGMVFELAISLLQLVPNPYRLKRKGQPPLTDRVPYTRALSQAADLIRGWPQSLLPAIKQAVVNRSRSKRNPRYTGISDYLPALESEFIPDIVKTTILAALAPIMSDPGSMPVGQVAMMQAVDILGWPLGTLAEARRKNLLKTRISLRAGRIFPALDSAEVASMRNFLDERTSAEAASVTLGLPQYAMGLLREEGLITFETHPYLVSAYGSHQLRARELKQFVSKLQTMAVGPGEIEDPVHLHRLARSLGGGFKPWGRVFHRMLKEGMKFSIVGKKVNGITISARDAAYFTAMNLREIKPSSLPGSCSQRDAVEILNLPLKYAHLLDCQPELNGKWLMNWSTILDLAREWVTLTEMAARSGIPPVRLKAHLESVGCPRCDQFGWRREEGLKALQRI